MLQLTTLANKKSFTKSNGDVVLDLIRRAVSFLNIRSNNGQLYSVPEDEAMRPDLIAYHFYQDLACTDLLLKYNGYSNPFALDVGDVLRIPSAEILSAFGGEPSNSELASTRKKKSNVVLAPKSKKDKRRLDFLNRKAMSSGGGGAGDGGAGGSGAGAGNAAGTWLLIGNIKGAGVGGAGGAGGFSGAGPPILSLGINGDYYIDSLTGDVYVKTPVTEPGGAGGGTGGSNMGVPPVPPNIALDNGVKIANGKIVFGSDVTSIKKDDCPDPISRTKLKEALIKNRLG